jgi:hypothetical protein
VWQRLPCEIRRRQANHSARSSVTEMDRAPREHAVRPDAPGPSRAGRTPVVVTTQREEEVQRKGDGTNERPVQKLRSAAASAPNGWTLYAVRGRRPGPSSERYGAWRRWVHRSLTVVARQDRAGLQASHPVSAPRTRSGDAARSHGGAPADSARPGRPPGPHRDRPGPKAKPAGRSDGRGAGGPVQSANSTCVPVPGPRGTLVLLAGPPATTGRQVDAQPLGHPMRPVLRPERSPAPQ